MSDNRNHDDLNDRTRAEDWSASLHDRSAAVAEDALAAGPEGSWPMILIGGASVLAGIAAILAPLVAGFAVAVTLGLCLVFCGGVGVVAAFRQRDFLHMGGIFALSILTVAAGAVMLVQPALGLVAIATLIIAWLGASGMLRVYYGIRRWSRPGAGAGLMIATGVLSIILALLLWFAMPQSVLWLPGVIVGVDLVIWGGLLLWLGIAKKVALDT